MKIDDVMQKLSSDPVVWSRVRGQLSTAQDRKTRFIELARDEGMSVDRAELERAVATFGRELSESELASVSGGFNPQPDPPGRYLTLMSLLLPPVQY